MSPELKLLASSPHLLSDRLQRPQGWVMCRGPPRSVGIGLPKHSDEYGLRVRSSSHTSSGVRRLPSLPLGSRAWRPRSPARPGSAERTAGWRGSDRSRNARILRRSLMGRILDGAGPRLPPPPRRIRRSFTDRSSSRRERQLVEAVTHQSLELRGILGSVGSRYPRSVLPEEAHDIEGGFEHRVPLHRTKGWLQRRQL
jgi:hypothetical protein